MISLIKMSLKLLLRNKGFLFFLLITPMVSAFILNVKMEHAVYNSDENIQIPQTIAYLMGGIKDFGDQSQYKHLGE